ARSLGLPRQLEHVESVMRRVRHLPSLDARVAVPCWTARAAAAATQPSRALGYRGAQPVADLNRWLLTRRDRVSEVRRSPSRAADRPGSRRHGALPAARERACAYSRLVNGSSSTTLKAPAGAPSVPTTAVPASTMWIDERNVAGGPGTRAIWWRAA